jgi:branched-chain amino acid transport system permease protein
MIRLSCIGNSGSHVLRRVRGVYKQVGEAVIAGIGIGSIYGMISMGYTLILAVSGVFNFAQGSIVMGGTLALFGLWQVAHVGFLLVLLVLACGGIVLGILTYLSTVLPIAARAGTRNLTEGTLLTTFGLGLVLNTIAGMTFGYATIPTNSYVTRSPVSIVGLSISPVYLVMIGAGLALVIVMELVLHRTRAGLIVRAVVEDVEGSSIMGIKVSTAVLSSFGIAGALAAIAGALLSPILLASVNSASSLVLFGFAGMAIGGFGSFSGAAVGGIFVGLTSTVVPVFLNADYANLILYGAVVLFLLIRPRGLFGTAGRFGATSLREV